MGPRDIAELGRGLDEVAAAFWVSRRITRAGELWAELEQLSPTLSADAESALHSTVSRAVIDLARAYLTRPGTIDMPATLETDEETAQALALRERQCRRPRRTPWSLSG